MLGVGAARDTAVINPRTVQDNFAPTKSDYIYFPPRHALRAVANHQPAVARLQVIAHYGYVHRVSDLPVAVQRLKKGLTHLSQRAEEESVRRILRPHIFLLMPL